MKPVIAIPAIAALVYRAWSHKSLTPVGIIVAALTAIAHAVHPWGVFFSLLVVFFLGGTRVTKVKHDVKARLTISASGSAGGEGPRNYIQVLANSVMASVLILIHRSLLMAGPSQKNESQEICFSQGYDHVDLFVVGIVANYAAVAADTFSSELGILSKSPPRLITSPTLRVVPPGTNGGVTLTGLVAGLLGAFMIAVTSVLLLPFCNTGAFGWNLADRMGWVVLATLWGALGSVVDSILGALLQASVVDKRTGKVVEGSGGRKVLIRPSSTQSSSTTHSTIDKGSENIQIKEPVANTAAFKGTTRGTLSRGTSGGSDRQESHESRRIESGFNILDNNGVNLLMAALMSVGAMLVAGYVWNIPPHNLFSGIRHLIS